MCDKESCCSLSPHLPRKTVASVDPVALQPNLHDGMRSRGVRVRCRRPCRALRIATLYVTEKLLRRINAESLEPNNNGATVGILKTAQLLAPIQEIKNLPTSVNLKECNRDVQVRVSRALDVPKDVFCSHDVEARALAARQRGLPPMLRETRAKHREGLSAPGLSVREARCFAAPKDALNQPRRGPSVDLLVRRRFSKDTIEAKLTRIGEFGQINPLFRCVDDDLPCPSVPRIRGAEEPDAVAVLARHLRARHWSLPHHHLNARSDNVAVSG